jgi:multidrug transporter EmrE-like cation transporter
MITPLQGGILLTVSEALGDYSLKKYAMEGGVVFATIGVLTYLGLSGILIWLFKTLGLAITNAYWDATSNLMTMAIGYFVFNEFYTIKQWIGMFIVTAGLILINGN